MNYAWANPSTRVRQQAATAEEARYHAWEALQLLVMHAEIDRPKTDYRVQVYEQEAAGWVAVDRDPLGEIHTRSELTLCEPWEAGYAFASPKDGRRAIREDFASAVSLVTELWPEHSPAESVTIYRQRPAFEVKWDDPKPPAPIPAEIQPDTPSSLIEQIQTGTCSDPGRAQLLAMLWIAQSLQAIQGKKVCEICGRVASDGLCQVCALKIVKDWEADVKRQKTELENRILARDKWKNMPHLAQLGQGMVKTCFTCGLPVDHAVHEYTGA
jgi:hypothetical protein